MPHIKKGQESCPQGIAGYFYWFVVDKFWIYPYLQITNFIIIFEYFCIQLIPVMRIFIINQPVNSNDIPLIYCLWTNCHLKPDSIKLDYNPIYAINSSKCF